MADSSPVDVLSGRTFVLAGEAGTLRDQAEACLAALGARAVKVAMDGLVGPSIADLGSEARVQAALDRVAALVGGADALVFVGRDLRDGERLADFIEEGIASYHFHLKLAKRLRVQAATDVVALAWSSAVGEEAALAADIRNGALRQMTLVAASEGGPMQPPLLANAVTVVGQPEEPSAGEREGPAPRMEGASAGEREGPAPRMEGASARECEGPALRMEGASAGEREGANLAGRKPSPSLTALLGRLLARPQGYMTGTSLTVAL